MSGKEGSSEEPEDRAGQLRKGSRSLSVEEPGLSKGTADVSQEASDALEEKPSSPIYTPAPGRDTFDSASSSGSKPLVPRSLRQAAPASCPGAPRRRHTGSGAPANVQRVVEGSAVPSAAPTPRVPRAALGPFSGARRRRREGALVRGVAEAFLGAWPAAGPAPACDARGGAQRAGVGAVVDLAADLGAGPASGRPASSFSLHLFGEAAATSASSVSLSVKLRRPAWCCWAYCRPEGRC